MSILGELIVIVLTLTGLSLLRVPPEAVGATGAALLVLGPLGWAVLRRMHGLPAFAGRSDEDHLTPTADDRTAP